ncbi:unnamed protein product [Moneuplotes crassus]|uniref:Uncharacterized protein n=1 Tax=Euplotes crassus TaxID=5936 RepID=A0AAD1XG94_EUPCR|nr:unnamed protein product [Moneuplotes crassus]
MNKNLGPDRYYSFEGDQQRNDREDKYFGNTKRQINMQLGVDSKEVPNELSSEDFSEEGNNSFLITGKSSCKGSNDSYRQPYNCDFRKSKNQRTNFEKLKESLEMNYNQSRRIEAQDIVNFEKESEKSASDYTHRLGPNSNFNLNKIRVNQPDSQESMENYEYQNEIGAPMQ